MLPGIHMETFAVLDIETNYRNEIISIGVVAADDQSMEEIDSLYFIIDPAWNHEAMYSHALFRRELRHRMRPLDQAMMELQQWLSRHGIRRIFAYNGRFDKGYLGAWLDQQWYDIMRLAAYKQYNPAIPCYAPCCKTGRLKKGYSVEATLSRLRGELYTETHNALCDARDELEIMRRLGHALAVYEIARI